MLFEGWTRHSRIFSNVQKVSALTERQSMGNSL